MVVQLVVMTVLGMEIPTVERTAGRMVGSRAAKRVAWMVGLMVIATAVHSDCCWVYAKGSCLVVMQVCVLDEKSVEC